MNLANKPVFPRTMWTGNKNNDSFRDVSGLTYREWLIGMALQGVTSNIELLKMEYSDAKKTDRDLTLGIAKSCMEFADGIIFQLEQETK